jgi:hypothetical protein
VTRRDPMLRSHERAARQQMASTMTFRRPGTATLVTATNEEGDVDYTSTVVYTGKATVSRRDANTRTLTYGSAPQTVGAYEVTVPEGAGILPRDVGTVDTSVDDRLVGLTMRVVDQDSSDWSSAPVLLCETPT